MELDSATSKINQLNMNKASGRTRRIPMAGLFDLLVALKRTNEKATSDSPQGYALLRENEALNRLKERETIKPY